MEKIERIKDSEVFIHIGYPKTGTTFLQRQIFPKLEMNHILTPDVSYIAEGSSYDPNKFIDLISRKSILKDFKKAIVSQETLSGRSDGNPIWDKYLIARRLHATFPNAKIIFVVRNQATYILSLYEFRVNRRGLEWRSLLKYLDKYFEYGLKEKLQYDKLINYYMKLFKGNVLVLPFELLVENHTMFVNRILEFMDYRIKIDYSPQRINKGSRDAHIILLNRIFNLPFSFTTELLQSKKILSLKNYIRFANRFFRWKQLYINSHLSKFMKGNTKILFDNKWERKIIQAYSESNHKLAKITDLNLEKLGYPW